MEPTAVTVRYRYSDGDGPPRDACFRGRFFLRTEAAVLASLREAHRFAERIDVVEVRWHEGGDGGEPRPPGERCRQRPESPGRRPGPRGAGRLAPRRSGCARAPSGEAEADEGGRR